jgi:hypothetical protein
MIPASKLCIIFSIIGGIVVITAIDVPKAIFLPKKADEAAITTAMAKKTRKVTTSEEISSTIKGQ